MLDVGRRGPVAAGTPETAATTRCVALPCLPAFCIRLPGYLGMQGPSCPPTPSLAGPGQLREPHGFSCLFPVARPRRVPWLSWHTTDSFQSLNGQVSSEVGLGKPCPGGLEGYLPKGAAGSMAVSGRQMFGSFCSSAGRHDGPQEGCVAGSFLGPQETRNLHRRHRTRLAPCLVYRCGRAQPHWVIVAGGKERRSKRKEKDLLETSQYHSIALSLNSAAGTASALVGSRQRQPGEPYLSIRPGIELHERTRTRNVNPDEHQMRGSILDSCQTKDRERCFLLSPSPRSMPDNAAESQIITLNRLRRTGEKRGGVSCFSQDIIPWPGMVGSTLAGRQTIFQILYAQSLSGAR